MKNIEVTADGIAWTGAGWISSLSLFPGTAAAKAVIYDSLTATGTVIDTLQAVANGQSDKREYPNPVRVKNGVYVDLTGAGSPIAYVGVE